MSDQPPTTGSSSESDSPWGPPPSSADSSQPPTSAPQPAESPAAPSSSGFPPPPPAPPAQQAVPQPAPGQGYPPPPQMPPAGPGSGYPPPQANPYGSYAPAPPSGAYGAPVVGTLPYVEANFGPVASFGQRAGAYLIDAALTLIGLIPMFIGMFMMISGAASASSEFNYETGVYETSGGSGALAGFGVLMMLVAVWLCSRRAVPISDWPSPRDRPARRRRKFLPARGRALLGQPDLLPVLPLDALGRQPSDPGRHGHQVQRHRRAQELSHPSVVAAGSRHRSPAAPDREGLR